MVGTTPPRIPPIVFKVVMGILFGSAIVTAIVRTGIRIKLRRRVYLDDVFLGLACLTLTAATTYLYKELGNMYLAQVFVQDYLLGDMVDLPADVNVAAIVSGHQRNVYLQGTLSWIVIFSVKFSFLSFFHQLLDRLPRFLLYWKVVLVANVVALLYCICYAFLECPQSNLEALSCLNAAGFEKAYAMTGTGIAVDVVTDMLIVSIPTSMLWQVRMKTKQKLGIGAFLCLSFCMIVVACVRFSGLEDKRSSFNIWQSFWLEVEACVAVCMISLTAFRAVFASNLDNANATKARPLESSTIERNRERKQRALKLEELPRRPRSITVHGLSHASFHHGRNSLKYEEIQTIRRSTGGRSLEGQSLEGDG